MKKTITEDEEVRCWFKVSSNRKKVWNIQLWLLEELKKICEKHNLKYFASWGTMLWAIRHKWYIPRDDDMDFMMFRKDYEKFREIAPKELPKNIKLKHYHQWWSNMTDITTTTLWDDNWWDNELIWGISIDIFPIDYASKYSFINWSKTIVLLLLRAIILAKKSDAFIKRMKKWKRPLVYICKFIFSQIDYFKVYQIHEKITRKTLFKWNEIYNWWCPYKYYPTNIFNESLEVKFENTTIYIPGWYDVYLKKAYWDYMKPIIREWWHHCRYSVTKSFKDIVKTFDRSKSNEDNYNNCEDLFTL